jgi:transcriptional regulator with XRE-family HTH domain
LPFCKITLKTKKPQNPAFPKTLINIGDHVRKRRVELKQTQTHASRALGVTKTTVTGWERGYFAPKVSLLPKIIAYLGYVPPQFDQVSDTLAGQMKAYRLIHGLSHQKLADRLRVDVTTVSDLERGKRPRFKILIQKLEECGFHM